MQSIFLNTTDKVVSWNPKKSSFDILYKNAKIFYDFATQISCNCFLVLNNNIFLAIGYDDDLVTFELDNRATKKVIFKLSLEKHGFLCYDYEINYDNIMIFKWMKKIISSSKTTFNFNLGGYGADFLKSLKLEPNSTYLVTMKYSKNKACYINKKLLPLATD